MKKRKIKIYTYRKDGQVSSYQNHGDREREKLTVTDVLKSFNLTPVEAEKLLNQVFTKLEAMEITEENTDK